MTGEWMGAAETARAERVGGAGFDAVLIGGDLSRGEAAVLAAGGRVRARLRWGEAIAAPAADADAADVAGSGRPVLLVEAEGAGEALLAEMLPAIAAAAAPFAVMVAFDRAALDVVAANLWVPGAELLCDPRPAERAAALARAVAGPEAPRGVREEDGTLPDYTPDAPVDGPDDAASVRRALRARRMREPFFGRDLFSDPAWDMLLDLHAAEAEGVAVSVSSLCIAAAVAPTTALRWIARMTEEGLLDRRADATDRRRAFMALTDVARARMRAYLAALERAGLAVG